jgi:ribosomal protein S18 acetylase RimI-like enzyme
MSTTPEPRPGGPELTATLGIPGLAFRHGRPGDWDAIAAVVNRGNAADGVEESRSGTDMASDFGSLDAFEMERDALLAELDGEVVAFGFGYRVRRDGVLTGETWGAVVPEIRRRGVGTAIWQANAGRVIAEMSADPRPGPRELRSFCLDVETGDRALLEAQGYVSIRSGFVMRRFLTGTLPEHSLPPGLALRPVEPADHRAIFDGNDEAFRDHWGHRERGEREFRALFSAPATDTSLWCVAWDGDQVAGVVINTIYREENAALGVRRGWLDQVSVRRPWRGRGVAKALCTASFRILRERGMDEAWLGVDGANPTGALQLYEGLGFTVARRWQAYARPIDGPAPPGWRSAGVEPEAGRNPAGA